MQRYRVYVASRTTFETRGSVLVWTNNVHMAARLARIDADEYIYHVERLF